MPEDPAMSGLLEALQGVETEEMENPVMKNPATQPEEEDKFFLPPGMFDDTDKLKRESKVMIRARVVQVGSKIELRPVEVKTLDDSDEDTD